MKVRLAVVAALILTGCAVLAAPALASVPSIYHGGTYIGSVMVEPGQTVKGDLTVIAGDATIAGVVDGNVDVIGGDIYERPGATITGQVNTVGGDVVSAVVPWSSPPDRAPATADYRTLWHIASGLIVMLFFLVFPLRTRIALDRLERHPGLCAAVGLLGWVAVLPLAVLLLCTILLIPFIALEAVAIVGAVFLGKAALALLVGRRLCELIKPATTPAPLVALLAGLILVTAAELVPVIGILVTVFVFLIGMGAAILAFTGVPAGGPSVAVPRSRPPLSGPPMPAA
ncbi:MAG: polymer-forming cytoskeletal protein [Candidatus Tumulicola sp.]